MIAGSLAGTGTMNTPRLPEFLPGKTVKKSMADMTSTPKGKTDALRMFNNCVVKEQKDHWILIMATKFVCEGIARELGWKVYRALPKYGPNHYAVDTRRAAFIAVV